MRFPRGTRPTRRAIQRQRGRPLAPPHHHGLSERVPMMAELPNYELGSSLRGGNGQIGLVDLLQNYGSGKRRSTVGRRGQIRL